jgi:hypothetical protein
MVQDLSATRSLVGRVGAETLHSKYGGREITQQARDASPGSDSYWDRQVDPDGVLDPQERARRAGHAKKAYFARLALKSAMARRKKVEP